MEVITDSPFDSVAQALMDTAAVGTVTGILPGTAAIGDIRADTNPSDGDWIRIGITTNYIQYRFKNTLAAAGDVLIGATRHDTAANLSAAINLGAGAGTAYHVSTPAGLVTSAIDADVLTITDKLACDRQEAWVLTESASNFSKRVPQGGIDGSTVFTISVGQTTAANSLTFSTEDHSTVTLPALMLATSTNVNLAGNAAMLRIWSDNAFKFKIQSSTDQTNWWDTTEGVVTITPSTMYSSFLTELHEFIRFVITENLNTDGTILDARVIY